VSEQLVFLFVPDVKSMPKCIPMIEKQNKQKPKDKQKDEDG